MYYRETLIHGVLHAQTQPGGKWTPLTAQQLSNRVVKSKGELDSKDVQISGLKNTVATLRGENNQLHEDLADARINPELGVLVLPVPIVIPTIQPNGFVVIMD